MQIALANNRQARRRVHVRPNLTIMKGTIADLKFVRYGDMVVPVIMGKERRRVINHILPQGLNNFVNNIVAVNNTSQSGGSSISGWGSSPGNAIQLLNNGSVVQTLIPTVIPTLNGSTVIWVFIASDLSSASYTANQVNLFVSVNYVNNLAFVSGGTVQYSPGFNLATATTNIVKQSGETISFIWEIQLNLGSSALTDFILGMLYSIPTLQTQCYYSGSYYSGKVGTFAGTNAIGDVGPFYFSSITLQYLGGSSSSGLPSVTTSYDGTNTYLIISASITLSAQVTATSVIINVKSSGVYGFCVNEQLFTSGSVMQVPYNATLQPGTYNVTVTIEFSPAT